MKTYQLLAAAVVDQKSDYRKQGDQMQKMPKM
jgi:hypothetical protein